MIAPDALPDGAGFHYDGLPNGVGLKSVPASCDDPVGPRVAAELVNRASDAAVGAVMRVLSVWTTEEQR